MSNQHLTPINVQNPIVISPTAEQQRLTKCGVNVYKERIAKQPAVTGECWVYKHKYTLNKKHEQINNRKRKALQSDTVDNESDQLDPSDTEDTEEPRSEKKKVEVVDDANYEYNEDGMKHRPIQKKSKNIRCKAQLMVYCYEDDEDNVELTYVNNHDGHVPGSIGDVQYLRKSKELNDRILEELHKGYHVPKSSRFGHINTVDVYNILCKYRKELCCLDKDDFKSVKKQLEAFQSMQYYIWIDVTDNENPSKRLTSKDFAFGFVAPWQLEYFEKAQFVSLDATHEVSKYKDGVLYTMVIRDPVAGRGVPITYLLTNDLSSKPLLGWFRSLATIGLNPQRFTIDNSLPEDNAIVQVWPSCSIQHCIWHVMRAWMQNVQAKIHGSIGRTPTQAKAHIRPRLKELMYEKNTEQFHVLLSNFLTEFQDSQCEFITYFKTYYIDKWDGRAYERWDCSYQPQVFYAMSTNNYIESWHNQLKTIYLKQKRTYRLDVLMNLLADDVSFDITEEVNCLSANVGRIESTERCLRANEIKAEE
ncbi:hypothetical protein INT45_006671 [Circinella minor]|uniref:MULE transposase domain-containing protein n=1 Tax=Circinella minor TaxID=1195481 RepID=A0A8H7RUP9_9FUNG|nr:hypothetical protein INT45_006671 [Circinella minor]